LKILLQVLRTIGLAVATLLIATLLTFFATNLSGVNAAQATLGRLVTPQELAAFRAQQGLDQPIATRYFIWIEQVARGNLGVSLSTQQPGTQAVYPRAERSVILALSALAVALPLAVFIGALAALRPGGLFDNLVSSTILLVLGVPEFVIGLLLLYVFAIWLKVLPPNSSGVLYGDTGGQILAYLLPGMTLAVLLVPYLARMVRSSAREVLATPYIQSAILRGVRQRRLLLRHVMPNAIGPVINVVALSLAEVLVGIVVVENVFGFPGLGQLMISSVGTGDVAVLQACVLLAAIGFIALNLLADMLVVLLNPRLRRRQL
jgi:peptide/nickel transport system permease protein